VAHAAVQESATSISAAVGRHTVVVGF
jgi:hypothetical protein